MVHYDVKNKQGVGRTSHTAKIVGFQYPRGGNPDEDYPTAVKVEGGYEGNNVLQLTRTLKVIPKETPKPTESRLKQRAEEQKAKQPVSPKGVASLPSSASIPPPLSQAEQQAESELKANEKTIRLTPDDLKTNRVGKKVYWNITDTAGNSISKSGIIKKVNPDNTIMVENAKGNAFKYDPAKEAFYINIDQMSGKGLAKAKKYQPIERSEGYAKPKPYTQFGRYMINKHKLEDGILMIRRPKGGGLNAIPTEKISQKLVHIFKTLSSGGVPSYEEMGNLSHGDKITLYNAIRQSQIENVSVPHPTKSMEQKEQERFDILKGEILAGNDNKTLVREFKVLIMKFIQDGRLPRRQAHEILTDLTALGF
jgi:hypothetical protein